MMLDWRGQVAEATGANIFLLQNGELHTPTPDCFLDGITRRSIIALAQRHGIKVGEATLQLAQDYSDLVHGRITGVEPVPSTQR